MLLRLRHPIRPAELASLERLARERGYELRFLDDGKRVVELSAGPGRADGRRAADRSRFEELSCVAGVLDSSDAPELAERTPGRADTLVRVGDAVFGGPYVALVAGPCAVEDEGRLLETARFVRSRGATLLRGGAYKPRTSPHAFQGLGPAGLEVLRSVREEVGIAVVTEVLDPRDVERVAAVADMLQVGSRNMTNSALLSEVGRSAKPVLLKRGMAATAREFLLAAEYVLAQGNTDVVLCERGIRGFDRATRNVLDLGTLVHLKLATHLPVVVDPSHAAGRSELVLPLARAGIAAGADGLVVEVHPEPGEARSDGAQAITHEVFASLAESASALAELLGRTLVLPREGSVSERSLSAQPAPARRQVRTP